MPLGEEFNVVLPPEMADLVKSKVASGEYASEADVLLDGLRFIAERDRALENWLVREVVPAYDALMADPGRALSGDEVRASLNAEYARARANG